MTNYKISDVVLTESDLAEIDAKIEEHNQRVYGGNMPAHNKRTMRAKMAQDEKFAIWEARDYVPADEGEAPKGSEDY